MPVELPGTYVTPSGQDITGRSLTISATSPYTSSAAAGVALFRSPGDHLPPTVVAIGDSITVRNVISAATPYPANNAGGIGAQMGSGYLQMGCAALGQRLRFAGAFGLGGQTSTTILNTYLPLVLAMNPKPGWCIVETNLNDYNNITFALSMANHVSMAQQLRAAGIQPIMTTQLPCTGRVTAQRLWDQQQTNYIRKFCEVNGLPFLDFYAATIDPATGDYKTAFNDDNVHPSATGFWAMAQELLKLPLAPYGPPLTWETNDQINLVANGTMQGAGPVATSWSVITAGVGFTDSVIGGDPGLPGQWQQTVSTGNSTHNIQQSISNAGYSAGDILAVTCTIQTSGTSGGGYPIVFANMNGITWSLCNETGSGSTAQMRAWCADMDHAVLYTELTVPNAPGGMTFNLETKGGACVVRFGQCAVVNLTRQGILPSVIPVLT